MCLKTLHAGYTGKNCQYELDPCNPAECMNGGSCVGNSTHFRCDCTAGFTGPLCQHSLNECESSPCFHGICVDQEDGFRCFCQPVEIFGYSTATITPNNDMRNISPVNGLNFTQLETS
ncbi:hypothetical protein GQX74_010226 [Glossina fuscipes]|nr:hypothetical protein GQX74_010226 [Glossina fuscipes]